MRLKLLEDYELKIYQEEEKKVRYKDYYALQNVVKDFNSNRSITQYQKIKTILNNNPGFKKKIEREDFVTKRGSKAGKINKDDKNS